jgi:branched-chain amino acid transport system ATP-binding protein
MLEVRGLDVHYGSIHALQGVDLDVPSNRIVAVFGRNGAGKSTLVNGIMGLVPPTSGSIRLDGQELVGQPPHQVARAGVAIVPQGRRIFAPLSVEENLKLAARRGREGQWTLDRVYELLPVLAERRRQGGAKLSGGEQQMLAIARSLLLNPRLLLLDEPSEGLAPRVIATVGELLGRLASQGMPALLVEQNVALGLALADRVYVMAKGRIVRQSTAEEFKNDSKARRELLGVG